MKLEDIKKLRNADSVNVEVNKLCGINNPLLHMKLSFINEDEEFIIFADEKELDFMLYPFGKSGLVIEARVPSAAKNVSVLLKKNEEMFLLSTTKNLKMKRIIYKINDTMKKIISKIKVLFIILYRAVRFFWREYHFLVPFKMWKKYIKDFKLRMKGNGTTQFYNTQYQGEYLHWIEENKEVKGEYQVFSYQPLISILIPVYNVDENILSECIDSILNQSYTNFEVCLVDDHSTNIKTIDILKKYEKLDPRIKVKYRESNGHISVATNDALAMAKGEFVGLVDNDDKLHIDALYENVKALNQDPTIDMLYSDEDKLDLRGKRCTPHFKADFSPDTLLSLNYICHFTVLRKSIMDEIGGFTIGLEGAQDYDLFLRFTEKTSKIHHIAKILYHWRMVRGSTSMTIDSKSYALDKGKQAIENALKRRNILGYVEKDEVSTYYHVVYEYKEEPKVSIIIPCKDHADVTETCLKSLYGKTKYKNYEVILVDNGSIEDKSFKLFKKYKEKYDNFIVYEANVPFNYSLINNMGIKHSSGDVIVLLNNDTEVISPNWLSVMVGYAIQPHIGAVGPKLLYPDYTVQHAGVILGLGGVASHVYIGASRDDLGLFGGLRVPHNYGAVTAACLAVERKKFDEVNGLEEDLLVAYNDIDFNIKLLEKGYFNVCVPQVELIHHESKSRGLDTTGEKYKRFLLEQHYMYEKWGHKVGKDRFYNPNFSLGACFMLDKITKKRY